ncbi:hypothetical protein M1P56_17430 [Streptomyces sp. HU2014]|nr:hypothetical protein [Streptomyces sp. HU2014]UQI46004.1 hypothetical protein M1P56_17430 [Streptomyces sp. HU2014]
MSSALSRQTAEQAGKAAHDEEVPAYAALDRNALRAAAQTASRERNRP